MLLPYNHNNHNKFSFITSLYKGSSERTVSGIIFGALFFLCFLPGCWQESEKKTDEKKSLYVINLLDKACYTDCHIKDSVHVPFDELPAFVATLPKDTELIVYCANYLCGASGAAYKQLIDGGFTQVSAYEGGIAEWYQLGYPVEGTCTQEYLKKAVNQPVIDQEQKESMVSVRTITAEELHKKLYGAA